jgi:hypothetical protein
VLIFSSVRLEFNRVSHPILISEVCCE